jgi:hypothetical protein
MVVFSYLFFEANSQGGQIGLLGSSSYMHDKADEEEHQENEKQDLGDAGGCHRNATEAQQTRDDRNDQENQRVIKHKLLLRTSVAGVKPV